jgi:hypothetical protein
MSQTFSTTTVSDETPMITPIAFAYIVLRLEIIKRNPDKRKGTIPYTSMFYFNPFPYLSLSEANAMGVGVPVVPSLFTTGTGSRTLYDYCSKSATVSIQYSYSYRYERPYLFQWRELRARAETILYLK